jgi:1-acyl-sn-glycerol-3-phosphate acyltransferase
LKQPLKDLIAVIATVLPEEQRELISSQLSSLLENKFDEAQITHFSSLLADHGQFWGFNPHHPVAADIVTALLNGLVGPRPIQGIEHALEALELVKNGESVVMVGNHLSYGDANYLHAQLAMHGQPLYPLLVMAGPKVYTDPFRRLSSMCFDTLKMAQPPSKASGGADVSMRELAEITRKVIKEAQDRQKMGSILYFFPEGSRSRSGGLERFIPASARYCNTTGTTVYPIGFAGTDGLLGVDGKGIRLDDMRISIGPGIRYDDIEPQLPESASLKRKSWMDLLGFAVAHQLPESLRGAYNGASFSEDLPDWRPLLTSPPQIQSS